MIIKIIVAAMLIICSATDIAGKKVYIQVVGVFAAASAVVIMMGHEGNLRSSVAGAAIGAAFLIISFLGKGSVGAGDGVLIAVLGAVLGFCDTAVMVVWALMLCAAFSMILLFVFRKGRRYEVPFVPFLLGGYAAMLIVGGTGL